MAEAGKCTVQWGEKTHKKNTTCPGARETWIHCTSLIYQLCDLTQLLNILPQTVPSFVILYPSNTIPGGCEKAFPVPKGRIRKLSICILKGVDNKRESFSEVKLDYKRFLFKCHFLWTFSRSLSFLLFLVRRNKLTVVSLAPVKLYYR